MKGSYSERRQHAIDDQSLYGDTQLGEYRGVKWETTRSYGGMSPPPKRWDIRTAPIHHWCAYITIPNYDEEKEDLYLDCFRRSECTYNRNGVLGFDCGHSHDVEVYRDFPYVLNMIKDTIDHLKNRGM